MNDEITADTVLEIWYSGTEDDFSKLVLFHHDPSHDDETLDRLVADAVRQFKPKFVVSGGCEGAVFEVGPKS